MTIQNLKIMEFIKRYKWIILGMVILFLIVGAFWWFELRPNQIKKDCYNDARATEAKILALDNYIPFGKPVTEEVENCYIKITAEINGCYDMNALQSVQMEQKSKDCRTKIEAGTYDICYKRCLQEQGL